MRYLVSFAVIFVIIYAAELRDQAYRPDWVISTVSALILTSVFYVPLAICIWLDELRWRK